MANIPERVDERDTLRMLSERLLDVLHRDAILKFYNDLITRIEMHTAKVELHSKLATKWEDIAADHHSECECARGDDSDPEEPCDNIKSASVREAIHVEQYSFHIEFKKKLIAAAVVLREVIDRTEECENSLLDAVHDLIELQQEFEVSLPPCEETEKGDDAYSSAESELEE